MSIFDRDRRPTPAPAARRYTCEHCAWYAYDAEQTFAHMRAAHPSRVALRAPEPGQSMSPVVRRNLAAAERGEGLHRSNRKSIS